MNDHSGLKIFRVVGPPGCGKTTWASRQAKRAVKQYGPEHVLLLSLTRAGAREIGSRDTGVPEEMCGTLHSFCHRFQDGKKVVTSDRLDEWNTMHPQWAISPATIGTSKDRLPVGTSFGDDIYMMVDLLRNRLTPIEEWSEQQRSFFETWTAWLEENSLTDFTLMLEEVRGKKERFHGSLGVIIADEVQDFSALELSVLNLWASQAEKLVMVGDLHQSLYAFRGAETEVFEGEAFTVLKQSYRVPAQVHAVAQRLMESMSTIEPVEFEPTDVEGEVLHYLTGYKMFESYIPLIENAIANDKSIMVVASCGYMLNAPVAILRRLGIPFWNPFTAKTGAWNPLTPKLEQGQKSTLQRFQAYLNGSRGHWTAPELGLMTGLLVNVWQHGGKKLAKDLPYESSPAHVARQMGKIFKPELMDLLFEATEEPERIMSFYLSKIQEQISYMLQVLNRYGRKGIDRNPNVIIGTIHSVKGGEADIVILFPDLSSAAWNVYQQHGWEGRDSIMRLFYVGVTRAKETLILGGPSTRRYVYGL